MDLVCVKHLPSASVKDMIDFSIPVLLGSSVAMPCTLSALKQKSRQAALNEMVMQAVCVTPVWWELRSGMMLTF